MVFTRRARSRSPRRPSKLRRSERLRKLYPGHALPADAVCFAPAPAALTSPTPASRAAPASSSSSSLALDQVHPVPPSMVCCPMCGLMFSASLIKRHCSHCSTNNSADGSKGVEWKAKRRSKKGRNRAKAEKLALPSQDDHMEIDHETQTVADVPAAEHEPIAAPDTSFDIPEPTQTPDEELADKDELPLPASTSGPGWSTASLLKFEDDKEVQRLQDLLRKRLRDLEQNAVPADRQVKKESVKTEVPASSQRPANAGAVAALSDEMEEEEDSSEMDLEDRVMQMEKIVKEEPSVPMQEDAVTQSAVRKELGSRGEGLKGEHPDAAGTGQSSQERQSSATIKPENVEEAEEDLDVAKCNKRKRKVVYTPSSKPKDPFYLPSWRKEELREITNLTRPRRFGCKYEHYKRNIALGRQTYILKRHRSKESDYEINSVLLVDGNVFLVTEQLPTDHLKDGKIPYEQVIPEAKDKEACYDELDNLGKRIAAKRKLEDFIKTEKGQAAKNDRKLKKKLELKFRKSSKGYMDCDSCWFYKIKPLAVEGNVKADFWKVMKECKVDGSRLKAMLECPESKAEE